MKRTGKGARMFLRMIVHAAMLRKRTALSALLAIVVAATATTAMLDLFVDVQSKLRNEFRGFGANIILQAKSIGEFSPSDLERVRSEVGTRGLTVPFAYAVAHTAAGEPVVVAGTDFDLVRKLNPWWQVSSWPGKAGQALTGVRAAKLFGPNSQFTLSYQGNAIQLSMAGTVSTGSGEDSRIYISLPEFQSWTGLRASVIEIAAYGSAAEVTSLLSTLQNNFPAAEVSPVRQVTEGEANILGKMQSTLLWSSVFIIVTAALCVLATLTGWLIDRRRDFAIMKAIGASDRVIAMFITGEAMALACAGAIVGFFLGVGIAAAIGRVNFHAPVTARFDMLPPVLIGCLAITLLATVVPLRLLRRIQPAMILRGE